MRLEEGKGVSDSVLGGGPSAKGVGRGLTKHETYGVQMHTSGEWPQQQHRLREGGG